MKIGYDVSENSGVELVEKSSPVSSSYRTLWALLEIVRAPLTVMNAIKSSSSTQEGQRRRDSRGRNSNQSQVTHG